MSTKASKFIKKTQVKYVGLFHYKSARETTNLFQEYSKACQVYHKNLGKEVANKMLQDTLRFEIRNITLQASADFCSTTQAIATSIKRQEKKYEAPFSAVLERKPLYPAVDEYSLILIIQDLQNDLTILEKLVLAFILVKKNLDIDLNLNLEILTEFSVFLQVVYTKKLKTKKDLREYLCLSRRQLTQAWNTTTVKIAKYFSK